MCHTWPRIPHWKVTKIHLTSQTRAKRSALSQQVTTRQQWTDAEAWQTQDINKTNDPQKYCLGTVCKNILLEGLNRFHGTKPLFNRMAIQLAHIDHGPGSVESHTIWDFTLQVRLHYASITLQLRCCRTGYDSFVVSLRFCGAWYFHRRFSFDPTKTMRTWLHLVYADGDAAASWLRPRQWSYALTALIKIWSSPDLWSVECQH